MGSNPTLRAKGTMAEWLGPGLQNSLHWFDPNWYLTGKQTHLGGHALLTRWTGLNRLWIRATVFHYYIAMGKLVKSPDLGSGILSVRV